MKTPLRLMTGGAGLFLFVAHSFSLSRRSDAGRALPMFAR